MKLIFKITLLYLFISLVVFLLGGVITYQVIKREMNFEEQRFLQERLSYSLRMIEKRKPTKPFEKDKISIIPLGLAGVEVPVTFSDTLVMHSTLQRMEPHTKLYTVAKVGDEFYKITLYDLIIEEDDIEEGVMESLVKMYLLLTALILVLSWVASFWLLKPFNKTLEKIKNFSLKRNEGIHYEPSGTREFDKLNRFLEEMGHKMQTDYQSLKEFTENASHEMQTPLSITNGKLELLLESENLTDEQVVLIISAQESIQRLSKMSKALLLLTKIENKEFENIEAVNLSELISKLLFDFKELVNLKTITLQTNIEENVCVRMDNTLAALMITNLINNAIKHNHERGFIQINLNKQRLAIANSGHALKSNPPLMFERFRKGSQSKESIGLGLAIVKKICEVSDFDVRYRYDGEKHQMEILF